MPTAPPKPAALAVRPENIPAALCDLRQWVGWEYELRGEHWTKVPRQANGQNASSTDPATWTGFEEILESYGDKQLDGIGFVLLADNRLVAFDLDRDMPESVRLALASELSSYAEVSPGGNGTRIFVAGSLNGLRRRKAGPFEVYDGERIKGGPGGRYLTVTGHVLPDSPGTIEERQEVLDSIVARYLPAPKKQLASSAQPRPVALEDDDLRNVMFSARNGGNVRALWEGRWEEKYSSQSEADLALMSALAFFTGREAERMDRMFRSSGLMRPKWEERPDYRESTLARAIETTVETYSPPRRQRGARSGDAPLSKSATGRNRLPIRTRLITKVLERFEVVEDQSGTRYAREGNELTPLERAVFWAQDEIFEQSGRMVLADSAARREVLEALANRSADAVVVTPPEEQEPTREELAARAEARRKRIAELRELASPLLAEPNKAERLRASFRDAGWIGDTQPPEAVFYSTVSNTLEFRRPFERPASVELGGPSSGGKNYAAEIAFKHVGEDAVFRMTTQSPRSFFYMDDNALVRRTIFVPEGAAIEPDSPQAVVIRSYLTDGFVAHHTVLDGAYVELRLNGPANIVIASSREILDGDLANRCERVHVSDSPDLTRQIMDTMGRLAADPDSWNPPDLEAWRALHELLVLTGPHGVVIPFAERVTRQIDAVDVRLRRDTAQVLTMVASSAVFHSEHRERLGSRIVAEVADYAVAFSVLQEGLSEATGKAVTQAMIEAWEILPDAEGVTYRELGKALGVGEKAARLRASGLIKNHLAENLADPRRPARIVRRGAQPSSSGLLPSPESVSAAASPPLDGRRDGGIGTAAKHTDPDRPRPATATDGGGSAECPDGIAVAAVSPPSAAGTAAIPDEQGKSDLRHPAGGVDKRPEVGDPPPLVSEEDVLARLEHEVELGGVT